MKSLLMILFSLLLLAGCDNGAKEQLAAKDRIIGDQTTQITQLKQELETSKAALAKHEQALRTANQESAEQDQLIDQLKKAIQDKSVVVDKQGKRTRIRLPDRLLFRSGEAALARSGIQTLQEIGPVLAKYKKYYLEVSGFTDNAPIGPKLKRKFKNNLELSQDRAVKVIEYLKNQQKLGHQMAAVGFGEQFPTASNKSRGGRQENRRVLITLVPMDQRPR